MQAEVRWRDVHRGDRFETADGRCRFLFVQCSRDCWSGARPACADRCRFVLTLRGSRGDTRGSHCRQPSGLAASFIQSAAEMAAGLVGCSRRSEQRTAMQHVVRTQCKLRAKLRPASVISLPSPFRYAALPDEQNPGNARMLRLSDICWKLAITGIDSPNIQACACL